jgi:polysaccharide biosynthesis/export protein
MDTMWRNTTVKSSMTMTLTTPLINARFRVLCASLLLMLPAIRAHAQAGVPTMPGAGASGSATTGPAAVPSLAGKLSASSQGALPGILPKDFSLLRIEPGDLLSVNVYDTPELTDAYRVDPEGELKLPLCGKVKVEGLTSEEVARLLEATLKDRQILNQPQVNVDVQQYAGQYVIVLGEVASPGRVNVMGPTTLSEVLSQAGGPTALAGPHIKIRHDGDASVPELDAIYTRSSSNQQTGSILVRPGDTVVVPRAGVVYVLGAVTRPGGYLMQEDGKLNVAQALAMSGGTVLQARTGGLRVIRRNPDGSVLDFALSYDGIANGSQNPLQLQAEDIVYVPVSKLKAAMLDATSIISSAVSAGIYTTR